MKRSSLSVVSNICEGSERGNDREFKHFLSIARASNAELEAQWHIAEALGLVSAEQIAAVVDQLDHLGRMLTRFRSQLAWDG
jgi:four helix bundle protein